MIDRYYAIDYQVHSTFSHDGVSSLNDHVERAIELGLDEIGFTEHKDFDPRDPVRDYFDYYRYREAIELARAQYGQRITIRMGLEVDYQVWFEDQIAAYLERRAFDFVLGSVHYVDSRMVMSPAYLMDRDREAAYKDYFEAVYASIDSGLLDVVGHLEYANRRGVAQFGPYDPALYRDELTAICDLMIEKGVALEINTAGFRHGIESTYPCGDHIALYAERGGRLLTIGSDAHETDDVADRFTLAVELAIQNGLHHIASYKNRQPSLIAIDRGF